MTSFMDDPLQQFCGLSTISYYAVDVLASSHSSIDKVRHVYARTSLDMDRTLEFSSYSLVGPVINFSSCQRNLIKTFQIEAITALITKMALVFS